MYAVGPTSAPQTSSLEPDQAPHDTQKASRLPLKELSNDVKYSYYRTSIKQ